MKKSILLYALALLLIVSAFALPPLAFRYSVRKAEERTVLADASDYILAQPENTMEKLECFGTDDVIVTELRQEANEEEVEKNLMRELQTLTKLGAVPEEIFAMIRTSLAEGEIPGINRHCMIGSGMSLVFEVYEVHLWEYFSAILDASTGKILMVQYTVTEDDLLLREFDAGTDKREMEAWAEYYDLGTGPVGHPVQSLDRIARAGNPEAEISAAVLKEAELTDGSGKSVRFGLTYRYIGASHENFAWGTWLRDYNFDASVMGN